MNGNLTLGSSSSLEFDINGNGSTPGTDFSQLTAAGNVNLGNTTLYLAQGTDSTGNCADLTPGSSFPIMSVGGTLRGALSFVDGSDTFALLQGQTSNPFPIDTGTWCSSDTEVDAELKYGTNSITATIVAPADGTPTGGTTTTTTTTTTAAPTTLPTTPKLTGSAPNVSGAAIAGQTLKLTSNGTWTSNPASTFTHQWLLCGSTCTPISGATAETYTITGAEVGKNIEIQVTAKNSAGSGTATSNEIGPIMAAPAVLTNEPSAGQVRSDLSKVLSPSGQLAKIPTLLKDGGYNRFVFKAPSAGKLTITWTASVKHKRETIATATLMLKRPGSRKISLRLSAAGRQLLKKSKRLTLIATAGFTASGHKRISVSRTIKLT